MNALKWIGLGCVVLLTLLLVGSYLNHRWQAPREETAYPPPGQLVAVNGHRLHVYAEGAGNPTLVFLSGSGTTAPILDFKALYSRLSDTYRVAVVERAGYGWSDDGATPRDIETVLNETRLALQRAKEDPPYVLFPHSISGLEALHWANRHPEEVVAIVGLDPAVPPVYAELSPSQLRLALVAFTARTGLLRLVPAICHGSEAVSQGHLTTNETAAYCAILHRRTMSANMLAEIDVTQTNAEQVTVQGIPDVPLYLFVSNGADLPVNNWTGILTAYAEAANGRYLTLDVSHYIHNVVPDVIVDESRAFIETVMTGR